MWDGLLELLQQILQDLYDGLQTLVCWILTLFFKILTVLMQIIYAMFPSWPVPEFMQNGLDSLGGLLNFLNWVVPLGFVGPLFAFMFSIFIFYSLAMPFYRGIMDLL